MATTTNTHDNGDATTKGLGAGRHGLCSDFLYQYQGFWNTASSIENIKDFQQNFKALDTDVVLATPPKSGTIWLKSLAFAIINKKIHSPNSIKHPLRTICPHDLVPFIDFKNLYSDHHSLLDFTRTATPHEHDSPCRLIATHVPFPSLAESVKNPTINCKIVYLCRNPQDIFISMWKFVNEFRAIECNVDNSSPLSMEEAFEFFCEGVSEFGPIWDHVLGYWKESLENPHKVLFLKYEDLKKEPRIQLKMLAEFIGYSFSTEEERQGVIEDIISLCSFDNMKKYDVKGHLRDFVGNEVLYRKGEVGDSKKYLTPLMVERLNRLMEEKLHGSGLVFPRPSSLHL